MPNRASLPIQATMCDSRGDSLSVDTAVITHLSAGKVHWAVVVGLNCADIGKLEGGDLIGPSLESLEVTLIALAGHGREQVLMPDDLSIHDDPTGGQCKYLGVCKLPGDTSKVELVQITD